MIYTDEFKIETAKRLKKLRHNKKGSNGKRYSHATLSKELTKVNDPHENDDEYRIVSNKSLAYYEVVNPKSGKFEIGKGMKVSTLFLLATFYGVSCDYLLGLKDSSEIQSHTSDELAFEMGLDSYSKEALAHMAQHSMVYKEELLTMNNIIHSFTAKLDEDDGFEIPQVSSTQDIEQGFLHLLSRYLFYTSGKQKISDYPNTQYFDDEILNEDELANLLLMQLQKNLQNSRDKHKRMRPYPLKKLKKMIAMRNAKNKETSND